VNILRLNPICNAQGVNVSLHHYYECSPPRAGMCVCTLSLRLNSLLHTSQVNGPSSLCKHQCSCKITLRMNVLLHTLQINGHSAVCMCWCVFSSIWFPNDSEHKSQWYGWSMAGMGWCSFQVLCQKNEREKEEIKFYYISLTLNIVKIHLAGVKLPHVDRQRQQLCFTTTNTPKIVHKQIIKVWTFCYTHYFAFHNIRSGK